jgi:hypothetical protein
MNCRCWHSTAEVQQQWLPCELSNALQVCGSAQSCCVKSQPAMHPWFLHSFPHFFYISFLWCQIMYISLVMVLDVHATVEWCFDYGWPRSAVLQHPMLGHISRLPLHTVCDLMHCCCSRMIWLSHACRRVVFEHACHTEHCRALERVPYYAAGQLNRMPGCCHSTVPVDHPRRPPAARKRQRRRHANVMHDAEQPLLYGAV